MVGAWRVLSRQALGGYGAVYLARPAAQQDGAPVALKVALHPNDPRFLREAELLRRGVHPHVPRLWDHGLWEHPAGPFPFLVMDWVQGVPLYGWAHSRSLTSRLVMRVMAPVAGALAATHASGGVHRDVKGGNILVRPHDFWPTLLDFGAGDFVGAPTLTRELLPPGTPYYRSPEALRFHWLHRHVPGAHYEPGPADDVYALGVTAYCLATNTYPPPVLPPELLASDPSFRPPELEPPEQWVTVCPELAALIRQMLSLEPSARGSAAELEQALEQAFRTAGIQADQPILPIPRPTGRSDVAPPAEPPERAARATKSSANQPIPQRNAEVSAARRSWTHWARVLGPGTAFVGGLISVFALQQWLLRHPPVEPPEGRTLQCQQDSGGADAGTSGLGREALAVRVDTCEPESSREEIGLEMPKKPLPGQARPPCKRREVEINRGCWKLPADSSPPCGEREYEWQGRCYSPILAPAPPATSQQR
jgi:serine/threonine protein kinase